MLCSLCFTAACNSVTKPQKGRADASTSNRHDPPPAAANSDLAAANSVERPSNSPVISGDPEPSSPANVSGPTLQLRGRRSGQRPSGAPIVPAATSWQPAPDDSEFSVVLTDVGLETRRFKSHPQLLRVEKRTTLQGSEIKVFLKDGRVIQLPGGAIGSLADVPAPTIMSLVGRPEISAPVRATKGAKKPQ